MKDPPYKIYVLYAAFLFWPNILEQYVSVRAVAESILGEAGSAVDFFFAKHCPSFAMLKCISKQNSINNPMWLKC